MQYKEFHPSTTKTRKTRRPGTVVGEISLIAALEEIVPATIPGWFIQGVTDHEGLVNQMQRVRPVDDGKKARLLTHLTPEKPEIIKALELFWKNRVGIETFASLLMIICVKFGLVGSANRLLEYLENEKRTLGILPCERADLIAISDSFNQGANVETVIDMTERIGEPIAWEHDKQKEKGMTSVMGYTVNFYGKSSDLLEHMRNPTDKNIRRATTKIGIAPTPYNPSKEHEGEVEKGSWSVHGLR